MAPQARAPQIKIGFPRDVVKTAKDKARTLNDLLSSRARAWGGYFTGLSIAYLDAHTMHLITLDGIKEKILKQEKFLRETVLGVILPAMVGGGMSALVADKGATLTKALLPVATKRQAALSTFAVGGAATITEDVVKQEVTNALSGLTPQPGSEWDAVGDSPAKFFLKLNKMVNDYTTDVTRSVEHAQSGRLDDYVNLVNAHLLSPFIQNAPMDPSVLPDTDDLARIFEIFLWVYWARQREVKYWRTTVVTASTPDNRGFVSKVWDGVTHDRDALERVKAYDAVKQLDPILDRLAACGISRADVAMPLAGDPKRPFLNILWVKLLGQRHPDSLLSDLIANLDANVPKSAFANKVIDHTRKLK